MVIQFYSHLLKKSFWSGCICANLKVCQPFTKDGLQSRLLQNSFQTQFNFLCPRVQFSGSYSPSLGICSLEGGAKGASRCAAPAQESSATLSMIGCNEPWFYTIQLKEPKPNFSKPMSHHFLLIIPNSLKTISNQNQTSLCCVVFVLLDQGVPNCSATKIIV